MRNLIEEFRLWLRNIFDYNYIIYKINTTPYKEIFYFIRIIFHIAIIVIILWIIVIIIQAILSIIYRKLILNNHYKTKKREKHINSEPHKIPFNNTLFNKANFLLTIVNESNRRYKYDEIINLCNKIEITLINLDTEEGVYNMERYCDELRYLLIYDYRESITMQSPTGIEWLMSSRIIK